MMCWRSRISTTSSSTVAVDVELLPSLLLLPLRRLIFFNLRLNERPRLPNDLEICLTTRDFSAARSALSLSVPSSVLLFLRAQSSFSHDRCTLSPPFSDDIDAGSCRPPLKLHERRCEDASFNASSEGLRKTQS